MTQLAKSIKTAIPSGGSPLQKENTLCIVSFFLILLCSLLSSDISGQDKIPSSPRVTITGKVIDQRLGEPVPYATVILKSKKLNKTITGDIADDDGSFEIKEGLEGDFILEVQYIGYKTYSKEISISSINKEESKRKEIDLGIIQILEAIEELDEVIITAERSTIEQKIDRKVINVGKDLAILGVTAADIMVNVPSVDIDQDGSILLRGNKNVRILIDGKPSNIDSKQLLQQIPSNSIKRIELITNPSAKYNPEGMSGIINIVLNRSAKMGFNGNVNFGLNAGIKSRYNGALDFNYRTGKFNIYGNYGTKMGKSPLEGFIERLDEQSAEIWSSETNGITHLGKFGVDLYLDDQNTISVYTNQSGLNNKVFGNTDISFEGNSTYLGQRYDSERDNNTGTYNLDYTHDFDKKGHTIEVEADYNTYRGKETTEFRFRDDDLLTLHRDDVDDDRTNTTLNLDYTNPLTDKSKLELGAEARLQRIDNTYNTTSLNLKDSYYSYDRNIHSLYGTYGKSFKKWAYQVGVRLEKYEVVGTFNQAEESNDVFRNEIFSAYPSAYVTYTPDDKTQKNSYQISYSRRVDRPGLGQINPIRAWSSARVTNVGNPKLIPQFTNSIEFNYTRGLEKGSFITSVFYRKIKDEITRFAFTDPQDPTRILFSYNNYRNNSAYGFEISGNYKLTEWWSFNTSFDLYSQMQKGVTEDELEEVENILYNIKMNHSFNATDKLIFQLIGLYRGANENLQYVTGAYYFMNIGARYSFLKGKGTINLSFNDILKTQQFSFDATQPIRQVGEFNSDTETISLGLSYRFGGGKNKALKRKNRDRNEKSGGGFL